MPASVVLEHERQHQKHEVEIGTDIVPHDLPGGFGGGAGRAVGQPCCAAAFHLRRRQAVNGHTNDLLVPFLTYKKGNQKNF